MPLWSMRRRRRTRGRTATALRRRTTCACRWNHLIVFLIHTPEILDPKPIQEILNKDENKYEDGYDTDGEKGPFYDAVMNELAAPTKVDQVDCGLPMSMDGDGTDKAAPLDK